MRVLSLEQRQRALNEWYPQLREDWEFLRKILQRFAHVYPEYEKHVAAFRLYFCLDGNEPQTLKEVGARFNYTASWVSNACNTIRSRIARSEWWDEATWPKPTVTTSQAQIGDTRVAEIAVELQKWRFHRLGTRRYMSELKDAAEELGIIDSEMQKFCEAIILRLREKR